ncbi:nuclear mitotic apparatus protein 1 isoform X7 [Salmo salar]|uniref:Nuclear mitotic apparatus protein 1 isoform X6 n=1 Tax=Salmo salar TaxID=8030 RepID=A0ABM3FBQ7_SALSA|nr:nuclear mitotic apparatus protein 1 isoform X6 [Salmo salar]XP_045580747.1 nuclear mitotic apparatus protein 1 isoform X7 [Salmo salar]
MVLHLDKEHALLEWVNHLNVDLPVRSINDLQDGVLLMKLVYKLRKEEPANSYLDQHVQERLKVVSDFLQGDCRCSTERGALISWDNISNGLNLEVELSKVLVLLYYHSVINNHVDLNQLEYKFEVELASMLRFVLDNENSLYLSENLEKYLRKKPLFSFNSDISSTSSSSLFNDDESPVFQRRKKMGSVQFLDLQTVASSSVSSPLQDVMNTPQFQLKKLQRQLRQERDMRDELEKDLTTSATTLTQRESQICQLQHRIEKLLREQAEQEQEPRDELQELHSKNEGLRTRLHEVLKECQALKTNSSQMERKVDSLTEENGTLSAQMREVVARLASAEAEVDRLIEAQDSAQGEWSSRHCHLQDELNRATAQKECLSEQMLILQSKISSLEDELSKAKMQEKGEVMGPILEWEQLKQELADATLRHAECECTIARLKGEKEQAAALHAQERASLQAESQRLQVLVTELQEALSALRADREALELASKEERESLTAQLHTLTAEVASLTQTVQQREQEVKALGEEVQQECMQRGELNLAMERQDREAREEIQELTSHVDTMGASLRRAEEEVQVREKQLTKQQQESALQREVLQEEMAASEKALKELKKQEEAVREEATRLHQEITTHVTDLCSLRQEHTALQEQLARQQEEISLEKEAQAAAHREKEAVEAELSRLQEEVRSLGEQMAQLEEAQREKERLLLQSTENMETLQTERAAASSLAEAKDLELSILREEVRAREEQLAMQQEEYRLRQEELQEELAAQENEINNMRERLAGLLDQISLLKEVCQEGKNMEALREEHAAQLEQLRLVKEQVEQVQERNEETSAALREKESSLREKESSLREKEESLRGLEEELQSTTSLASQRQQEELTSLKEEVISLQEEVERRRAAEALAVEEARELEESVSALQQQLDSAIQDNDMKRQKCERLEQDLEQRGTLVEELRQQEHSARLEATRLRQEISTHLSRLEVVQREKEELRGEVSLHQQRAAVLQQSLEEQEVAMRVLKEQKESIREETTVKIEALQAQLEVVSSLAAAKDLQLSTLREEASLLCQENTKRAADLKDVQLEKIRLESLLSEEHRALKEDLAKQQEELRGEVSLHQQRAAELQLSLEEKQEALRELKEQLVQQQEDSSLQKVLQEAQAAALQQEAVDALRGEVSLHQQRAAELQHQEAALREQEEKSTEEATLKMEALKAAKDLQLSALTEKATALQEQLAKREQEISLQKEVLQEAHREKESVEALREELARQQEELREELILQQQRAQSLEQSLEEQQEALKELTLKEERAREEATQLRQQISTHLSRLEEVQRGKEELREQEEKAREETTVKMEALQAQLEVVSSLAAAKDLQLSTLREEASLLCQENTKRAADLKDVQLEKIRLESLLSEEHRALKEDLAKQQEELRGEVSLHQQRAAELQHQEAALREQEEKSTEEATLKMEALKAAKDLQLSALTEKAIALQEQLAKREQEISLQKEVLQEAHREKESLEALREELARQQEELREELILQQQRAQSLEQSLEEQQEALKELTLKEERAREEATLKMVALQAAKDLELSTLRQEATQLRQEISTHVSHLEEVKSEGPLREEHTALQVQLAKQQEENSLQKGLLQEVQATVLQEREAKEALRGEVSLHQQSLEEQQVAVRETLARQKEEGQAAGQVQKELMEQFSVLQQEKEALLTRALQAEQNQSELEGSMAELRAQAESRESGQRQQLDALLLEKERLTEGHQVLEMKCSAAQRLEAVLLEELALLREQMEGTEWEKQIRDLREQLAANTEVVEHYKTQVEKAKSHYSGKKQQLVESQEQVTELQRSLEVREHEVNAVTTEMKLLQKELEKARNKEKSLSSKVNTLEAQLAFTDRHLREQSQVRPERGPGGIEKMRGGRESVYLKVPQSQTHQETSGDSLDLSLDDSLNTTTRPLGPDESSTPLVRSSERVAAKRRALGGESLETLYFTPMNNRQINRTSTERRLESSITCLGELALDSARKRPPTSSARRRRTTQVINITMSKTTPGRGGAGGDSDNEMFYSLSSVRSHPNITGSTHTARPISMEVFHTPGKPAVAVSDQLLSLPGYRRSTVHVAAPQSTGQFCVGAENEPDHAADDWLRIAELQARNQSCLPHLKSSYPLESRPSLGPSFEFTDDDLRMGDPTETIRRASVMPGQIQESLSSHRLSLHPGQADSTTASRPAYGSHRLSLMPPKPKASSTLNNQNTHNLRGSNLSLKRSAKDQEPDTPEVRMEAKRMATSCFPRPLTPKGGRFSSSNNRQPPSPAERRQSMVFSIDNTPRKAASKSGFLQRGMNKIRSSTRKSPANKISRVPRSGDVKSPQPGGKAQRKSPRTNSSKSPKNPTSARKEPEVLVGKPIHLSR